MQRIIGYECFLENTITSLCENLGMKRKMLGINTNFITEAMKDKKPGKAKAVHKILLFSVIFFIFLHKNLCFVYTFKVPQ